MAAREVAVYAHALIEALRAHASTLSYPNEPFTPPGGMLGFAAKAFQAAGLEPVGGEYVRSQVIWWLEKQNLLRREYPNSNFGRKWLLPQPASAESQPVSTIRSVIEALRRIDSVLAGASLAELAELEIKQLLSSRTN